MMTEFLDHIGNMKHYNVSVIIPVFNAELYIEKCCKSLFGQTLQSIEYIFVNDCSTDKSMLIIRDILKKYPDRISHVKILNNQENYGVSRTRQLGITNSTGDYLIHCDPDDWVDKELYEAMWNAAVQNNSDVVVCDYIEEFNQSSTCIKQVIPHNKKELFRKFTEHKLHSSLCNKLIRRRLLDDYKMGGVNLWEDMSIVPAIMVASEIITSIYGVYYHYRIDNDMSITKKQDFKSVYSKIEALKVLETNLQKDDLMKYINPRDLRLLQWHTKRAILDFPQSSHYNSIFPVSPFSHGLNIYIKDLIIRLLSKFNLNKCIL